MNKSLSILILSALPALGWASGDHAGSRDMHSDKTQMSDAMKGMPHEEHDGAIGKPGDPARVSRTIEVRMGDDMRFIPSLINVKAGETVRFSVRNIGRTTHEMVIGSMAELKEHAAMMGKMPKMKHAEPNMVSLDAGQRGGIVWRFDKTGTVDFACLVPGHLEAGMAGKISVN